MEYLKPTLPRGLFFVPFEIGTDCCANKNKTESEFFNKTESLFLVG